MDKKYRWTVDTESDFGGRSLTTQGLDDGLPRILNLFKVHKIKALFFVSTELLFRCRERIWLIKEYGHEIGAHGHFHVIYNNQDRAREDMRLSVDFLKLANLIKEPVHFRYPKFNTQDSTEPYSCRRNHVSLLRLLFKADKLSPDSTIYLHPFDVTEWKSIPPNLFCKLWYSQPKRAWNLLERLCHENMSN